MMVRNEGGLEDAFLFLPEECQFSCCINRIRKPEILTISQLDLKYITTYSYNILNNIKCLIKSTQYN